MLTQHGIVSLRHLNLWEVLRSHPPEVHRPDAVIISGVTALPAPERMVLMVSVRLLPVSAYRTCLGSVSRIQLYHSASVHLSLVCQLLLQIRVRPADTYISVSDPDTLGSGTDACQIFQNEQRAGRIVADECL